METLTKEEYNGILKNQGDLLLYFYRQNDAQSTLGLDTVSAIDAMIAKPFTVYIINADEQPEICKACGVKNLPEAIAIKNTRIYKRMTGLMNSQQLLYLMK